MDEEPVWSSFQRPPKDPGSPLKSSLSAQSVYRTSVDATPHLSPCPEATYVLTPGKLAEGQRDSFCYCHQLQI